MALDKGVYKFHHLEKMTEVMKMYIQTKIQVNPKDSWQP